MGRAFSSRQERHQLPDKLLLVSEVDMMERKEVVLWYTHGVEDVHVHVMYYVTQTLQ